MEWLVDPLSPSRPNSPLDLSATHQLRQFMPGRGNFFVAPYSEEIEAAAFEAPNHRRFGQVHCRL
jgi:hypothetical protein